MKQCTRTHLETSYPRTVRYILVLSSSTLKYTSFLLHARSQNKTLHEYSTLPVRDTLSTPTPPKRDKLPTPTPLKLLDYEVGTLRLMLSGM
jgi:hypothetical protein